MAILYSSNYDITIPFSDVCYQLALAANAVLSFTVPGTAANKYSARFTYNSTSNVFVGWNVSPTVPGAGTIAHQAYNEFKPGYDRTQRNLKGGDIVYFITPDAAGAYVGVRLMSLPS